MQAAAVAAAQDREMCPVSLKADLDCYTAPQAQTYGEAVDIVTLIPYILKIWLGIGGFKKAW